MHGPAAIATLFLLVPAAAAADAALTLSFDLGAVSTVSYDCGEAGPLGVTYVNSGANMLALVPQEGSARIFVNTVSGSGARYVSGSQEWITKGGDAMLIDTLTEETLLDCGS